LKSFIFFSNKDYKMTTFPLILKINKDIQCMKEKEKVKVELEEKKPSSPKIKEIYSNIKELSPKKITKNSSFENFIKFQWPWLM